MVIEDGCDPLLRELIAQRSQASDFGNARGIRNLVEQMLTLRNLRIAPMLSDMSMTPEQRNAMLLTVKTEDVQAMLA